MTPFSQPSSRDLSLQICELTDSVSAVGPFRAELLLDALAVARAVTEIAAAGTTVRGGPLRLLAGLHLDLAAADIAHAFGADLDARPHGVPVVHIDESISAAAWELVDACTRTIQWHLESSRAEHSGEQLLALTRALLQIDAARNVSRPGVGSPSWP